MGAEEIYLEYESGIKINRPELNKVLRQLKSGDTLVCTEISRITRSTKQLCEIIDLAVQRRIKLVIGDFIVDCTTGIGVMVEGMIKIMGVFAEMERNMTIERTLSGLANARAKGVRLGRPPKTINSIPKKVLEYFPMYKEGKINKSDYARVCGISRPTLYKYIEIMTD
jgi:DNA invertase Pin-like site-specific DNA recombinase